MAGHVLLQQWIFGGVRRETNQCFLVAVPDRKAPTLLAAIKTALPKIVNNPNAIALVVDLLSQRYLLLNDEKLMIVCHPVRLRNATETWDTK
ncbi:hypothetical protein KIN20_036390 [Parelaphostrongylus tenuis]|uniref:Uncharacterized protein n=1 Tax=Parelaphostrongylus tenuis TaxID=148309 RepID=A0AAD5RD38_PARTN|nr:hypothetical protein KIN20_036390 [Parelaphostrongylus tenuis]